MIAVRDLRKAIGEEEILRGVELEVAVGETLVIIGRSGGGKIRPAQASYRLDAAGCGRDLGLG